MDCTLEKLATQLGSTEDEQWENLSNLSELGANNLLLFIKVLQKFDQEERLPVIQEINKRIRKTVQSPKVRVPPQLIKATKDHVCKVNDNIKELLKVCSNDPPAIFESRKPDVEILIVRDVPTLYQFGSQLLDQVDGLRRDVFCVIINDANNLFHTGRSGSAAIEQLQEAFVRSGVDASLSQLRSWANCGGSHQKYMKEFGDGYLAVMHSGMPHDIM